MPILTFSSRTTVLASLALALLTFRSLAQDSRGFKFNNLTVSPYVNLECTYDSNVYYSQQRGNSGNNHGQAELSDTILTINPGVDLTYTGNEWGLVGNAWYGYDRYTDVDQLNADRYGESFKFYREAAKGWRLVLDQSYVKSAQNDSIADGGRGLWRDREQFELKGALSYQLSEKTGLTLSGMYSDLSYANDNSQQNAAPLYGWQEYTIGLEVARKLTEKSNLLISGSYQEYISDGVQGSGSNGSGDNSTGYTLMAGLGSRATERIRYRVLTGVNMFDYAGGDQLVGWSYSLDASWIINKKLAASIAGSSYFQPSERESNQAMQVYALSTGLIYRPMRKLSTRLDLAVRREENQDTGGTANDGTDDQYSVRARADYQLMRYVSVYGGVEYEKQIADASADAFDRYRGQLGLSFRY
ncbi:MAG: outer membrane beta-barrel protein [bacterium]